MLGSAKQAILEAVSAQPILLPIALVVILAALLAFIARMLKQDLILAYIIAGILIGPLCLGLIKDTALIKGFAEIGITFLLFIAGLEMSLRKFKETLGTVALTGTVQVFSVAALTACIFIAFKFALVEALLVGLAIAFSSTFVVTKILADKGELDTLHARLIIGIMLVQDLIAIVALALLSQTFSFAWAGLTFLKLASLAVLALLLHFTLLKPLVKHAASLPELLFVVTLAFLFGFVMLAYLMQLSTAIGAFVAGITLANSPFKVEIAARVRALRDFFSVMFFVAIGMCLTAITKDMLLLLGPMLAVLIFFEPAITALMLRLKGYKPSTSLQVGFSFAQLSEFTLVLAIAALGFGLVSQRAFDAIVLTAVVSIALTPYTMKLDRPLSKFFAFTFIKKKLKEQEKIVRTKKTILLLGCHRMGSVFLKQFEVNKHKILVIDFNPAIIKMLTKRQVDCIYGDVSNPELLHKLSAYLPNLKLVISTIPSFENNLLILKHFKHANPRLLLALTAQTTHEALRLYKEGADYVIVPLIISAEQSMKMLRYLPKKGFEKLRKRHIAYLHDLHELMHRA